MNESIYMQKRNLKTNVGMVAFPVVLCVILVVLQGVIDHELDKPEYRCGCTCPAGGGGGGCESPVCGPQQSTLDQVGACAIPRPPRWPELLQVPSPETRAVRTAPADDGDLPDPACRQSRSCPAALLLTGRNRSLAQGMYYVII